MIYKEGDITIRASAYHDGSTKGFRHGSRDSTQEARLFSGRCTHNAKNRGSLEANFSETQAICVL